MMKTPAVDSDNLNLRYVTTSDFDPFCCLSPYLTFWVSNSGAFSPCYVLIL